MELRRQEKIGYIKIVYAGAPGAGKTTNLGWLHQEARGHDRSELQTAALGQDRLMWFDFEPLQPTEFRGFALRFLVVTVPGAVSSGATRKHALRGADGVVFVADSSQERLSETVRAFRETQQGLESPALDQGSVPLVVQLNKRDAPNALDAQDLRDALSPKKLEAFDGVAVRGQGVLETFHAVLLKTLAGIAPQKEALPLLRGMEIEPWAEALLDSLYGRTSFSRAGRYAAASEPREDSRPLAVLQVAVEGPVIYDIATEPITRRLARADFEKALAAAEGRSAPTPPQAKAPAPPPRPAATAAPLPPPPPPSPEPEDDAAEPIVVVSSPAAPPPVAAEAVLYENLKAAVEATHALLEGAPLEPTLRAILARLARAGAATAASLLVPGAGGQVNVAARHGAGGDPIAQAAQAGRLVAGLAGHGREPRVVEPAQDHMLAGAVPGLGRFVSAPLRSPRGLHGLLLLYLGPGPAAPSRALVEHVGSVATALSLAIRAR